MFNGAHNTVVSGGILISQTNQSGEASEGTGLKLLQEKVAHGAFHNSDERFLAPRCDPHTRDDVLTTITDWIHDSGKKERLMWLCGPTQAGKSAIAQTIADRCYDANILMASFFFSRNCANCCDKSYLIPTIAYQLTVSIPKIRNRVRDVLRNDPLILSRSLEAQARALIVRPLTGVALNDMDDLDQGSPPRLVILDGIDECKGDEIQIYIINVLSIVVKELAMPLLFLITSRPEQHIVRAFSTKNMKSLRKLLTIDHCNHSSDCASVFSLDTPLLQYFPQESSPDHHISDDSIHISYSPDNYVNRPPDVQIPTIPLATDRIHHFGLLPHAAGVPLHIQASGLIQNGSPPHSVDDISTLSPPLPFVSQVVKPTHLKINHFGSRFLPHTTSQIRSVLPLLGNTMLLIGHDNGLSVLDMFPQEWTDVDEIVTKRPDEARCQEIWRGEAVYQMTILESEDHGTGTPQGVVLATVGPGQESVRDPEQLRTARMYSLSSLISLARWTVVQKGTTKPLDLYKMSSWQTPSTPSIKHRTQGSIARGLKSLLDSPPPHPPPEPSSSYNAFFSQSSTTSPSFAKSPHPSESGSPPARKNPDKSDYMVEDLLLRWATDFVPLAVPGSRLVGASVVGFATWSDENCKGKTGGQLLAIATKSNILLYETPKGERAYRFVKEFYTPTPPRNLTFIQQSVADEMRNPLEEETPHPFYSRSRSDSGSTLGGVTPGASSAIPLSYGTHLSLFVVYDKKAGWIRLADSAVGEVELGEDGGPQLPGLLYSRDTFSSTMNTANVQRQRSRSPFDIRESADKWIVPVRCELPVPGHTCLTEPVHILTCGKRTHVVPCPLPIQTSAAPPLHAVFWKSHPKFVSPRVILSENDHQPLLQLVAFGENGIEVQEMGVSFMGIKGRGQAFPYELIRAEKKFGGDAGFLSLGGNWDRLEQDLSWQQGPMPSAASVFSAESDTDILKRLKKEEGIYGWCRKGLQDWRIFWVGGNSEVNGSGEEQVYSGGIYG